MSIIYPGGLDIPVGMGGPGIHGALTECLESQKYICQKKVPKFTIFLVGEWGPLNIPAGGPGIRGALTGRLEASRNNCGKKVPKLFGVPQFLGA